MITSENLVVKKKFKESECSKVFIYDFKRNNRISSRKFYLKRRPENPNIEYQNNFINKIIDLSRKGKRYHVLNLDETGYSLVLKVVLTWSQANVDQNSRRSFTNDK